MKVARLGVARTFQTPSVPADLSVLEVIESSRIPAAKLKLGSIVFRTPKYRRSVERTRAEAVEWLELLGLDGIADQTASSMSLGTRRMIELARALSARPSLILLDEVASGLDADEVQELASVLGKVRDAGATVILVEHNFSLVQHLADHVVVLAEGSVLANGDPATVAAHPEVLERFLGTGAGISGTTIKSKTTGASASSSAKVGG
jgi:branched-chain amino acid transport system permease protein